MKKKVIMIGVVLIVCLGTIFYNMQKRDPYKSYNHLKTSEVLKVKEFNRYWVYFYSMDNQESMDSKNGIARLNKAVSNVYFVKIKDKEVVILLIRQSIWNFQYVSTELKNNKEVVLIAVQQNGLALKFASDELKKDKEIILEAIKNNIYALKNYNPKNSSISNNFLNITRSNSFNNFGKENIYDNEKLIINN